MRTRGWTSRLQRTPATARAQLLCALGAVAPVSMFVWRAAALLWRLGSARGAWGMVYRSETRVPAKVKQLEAACVQMSAPGCDVDCSPAPLRAFARVATARRCGAVAPLGLRRSRSSVQRCACPAREATHMRYARMRPSVNMDQYRCMFDPPPCRATCLDICGALIGRGRWLACGSSIRAYAPRILLGGGCCGRIFDLAVADYSDATLAFGPRHCRTIHREWLAAGLVAKLG